MTSMTSLLIGSITSLTSSSADLPTEYPAVLVDRMDQSIIARFGSRPQVHLGPGK
jgi:hypothetical protein